MVETLGYAGVALLTFAENLFPPIPSEVIMPLAGFAASRGDLNVAGVVVSGVIGSILGTSLYYWAGRVVREETLVRWIGSYGKWAGLQEDDLEKAKGWFERHGRWALLVCRCIPGVRTIVSLPAGMSRTPVFPFLAYSLLGTLIWTASLTYAGAALGSNYEQVGKYVGPVSWVIFAVLAAALALFSYHRGRAA